MNIENRPRHCSPDSHHKGCNAPFPQHQMAAWCSRCSLLTSSRSSSFSSPASRSSSTQSRICRPERTSGMFTLLCSVTQACARNQDDGGRTIEKNQRVVDAGSALQACEQCQLGSFMSLWLAAAPAEPARSTMNSHPHTLLLLRNSTLRFASFSTPLC